MEFRETDILVRYRVSDRPAGSQATGQAAGALPARPPAVAPFVRRVRSSRPAAVIRRVWSTRWPVAAPVDDYLTYETA